MTERENRENMVRGKRKGIVQWDERKAPGRSVEKVVMGEQCVVAAVATTATAAAAAAIATIAAAVAATAAAAAAAAIAALQHGSEVGGTDGDDRGK